MIKRLVVVLRSNPVLFDLLLLAAVSLALRLVNLGSWPRWYCDEGTYGQVGVNIFHGTWGTTVWGPNFFPPVFPVISGVMSTLFGHSMIAIRIPGAIAGAASVLLLYLIVNRLYKNRVIALLSAGMLSIASLYINRLAMMDNFMALFLLLTVFFYLKFKDSRQNKWIYLAGIAAGLSFLSKYTGICAILFLVVQSLFDKEFAKTWKPLLTFGVLAMIYPLLGLMNWHNFTSDTLFQASRGTNYYNFVSMLIMGHPIDQLYTKLYDWFFILSPWMLLGVVSCALILPQKENRILCILLVSVVFVYAVAKSVWWAYLVGIYPVYCTSIAVVCYDTARGIKVLLKSRRVHDKLKFALRWVPITIIIVAAVVIVYAIAPVAGLTTSPWSANSSDQQSAVSWLNHNTNKDDMVAAGPTINYMLTKAEGVDYAYVVLYNTRESFQVFTVSQLDRYKMDLSLSKFKYFVVDTPLPYIGQPAVDTVALIRNTWALEYQVGDCHIYLNPQWNNITGSLQ
jgi:4-amino-4-deoxy-L-arabinose transferase-like glycosyltransferase